MMVSMEFELKPFPLPHAGFRSQGCESWERDDVSDDEQANRNKPHGKRGGRKRRPQCQNQTSNDSKTRSSGFPRVGGQASSSDGGGRRSGGKGEDRDSVPIALRLGVGGLLNGELICFVFSLGNCAAKVPSAGSVPARRRASTKIGCGRARRASACAL